MNNEFKQKLLDTGIFEYVRNDQYRCKECPYCGDTKKHLYVKIVFDDKTPVLFNCFKCNNKGILNKEFLDYYNINLKIPKSKYTKRIETNKPSVSSIITCDENDNINDICEYIRNRIGTYPSIDDLNKFQYLSNPYKYIKEYLGNNIDSQIKNIDDRYWFRMTNGNMCGRFHNDDTKYRWIKYKPKLLMNSGLYVIKSLFDLHKTINVYIAEGVMDVIGLYYNYIKDNNIYIATLSSDYDLGLQYLIDMGIFGNSVNVKIFKDNDINDNDIKLSNKKILFKNVSIYHNILDKDVGVLPDKLEIHKCL